MSNAWIGVVTPHLMGFKNDPLSQDERLTVIP